MKSFPELKLVLIGHQRDPEYTKACFAEGAGQVIYAGTVAHDSPLLRSAYAACEGFVVPSTLESPRLEAHAARVRASR
jgi:hypothetical protein